MIMDKEFKEEIKEIIEEVVRRKRGNRYSIRDLIEAGRVSEEFEDKVLKSLDEIKIMRFGGPRRIAIVTKNLRA